MESERSWKGVVRFSMRKEFWGKKQTRKIPVCCNMFQMVMGFYFWEWSHKMNLNWAGGGWNCENMEGTSHRESSVVSKLNVPHKGRLEPREQRCCHFSKRFKELTAVLCHTRYCHLLRKNECPDVTKWILLYFLRLFLFPKHNFQPDDIHSNGTLLIIGTDSFVLD